MKLIFQIYVLTCMFSKCIFGEIGDLTVKKSNPLILNHWQQLECDKITPHAKSCDDAYKAIDNYYSDYSTKIDKECDESYEQLKKNCNKAEKSIKIECTASDGYVTAKCGKKLDRLENVCKIASETISRTCIRRYKKFDNLCNRKYEKTDLKCNRIYIQYKDVCELKLEDNKWNDKKTLNEVDLDEIEEKCKEIKRIIDVDIEDERRQIKKSFEPENKEAQVDIPFSNEVDKKFDLNGKSDEQPESYGNVEKTVQVSYSDDTEENKLVKRVSTAFKKAEAKLLSQDVKSEYSIGKSYNEELKDEIKRLMLKEKPKEPTGNSFYDDFNDLMNSDKKSVAKVEKLYKKSLPEAEKPVGKSYLKDFKNMKKKSFE